MNGSVSFIVLLKQLRDEHRATAQNLQRLERVSLGADVEDCFVLVVAQQEVLSSLREVLRQHRVVVLLEAIVQGQTAVVINCVRARVDFIDDLELLMNANNVLNRLSLVVLLAPSLVKLIAALEPVENLLIAVACALKQGVFT